MALGSCRPQGRERDRKVREDDLEDALGPAQIPQPVLAQIEEPHAVDRLLGDERPAGFRHQHLTTVG